MSENFFIILAAILLVPLIPAYIIYKFLPVGKVEDTDVSGPVKGLNLKLKGAFAGYFLLVLVGLALQNYVLDGKQSKIIARQQSLLTAKSDSISKLRLMLDAGKNPVIDWTVKGVVKPITGGTRFFYDDGTTSSEPDGSFELVKRCIAAQGPAKPPKWICVYNAATGFNVISLNREVNHEDIKNFSVIFDDNTHEIKIGKPIEINSKEKDSTLAIANYFESKPELKTKAVALDPAIFSKATALRKKQFSIAPILNQ